MHNTIRTYAMWSYDCCQVHWVRNVKYFQKWSKSVETFWMNFGSACQVYCSKQFRIWKFRKVNRKSNLLILVKFIFSKKATKLTKSSRSIWYLLHNVKSTVKILSNFAVFLKNINFTPGLEMLVKKTGIQRCAGKPEETLIVSD